MTAQYIVSISKPSGMPVKEFKRTVALMEEKRSRLSYAEKQQCQELLKTAGIQQSFGKGSLNFCVKSLLNELTQPAREVVELHMKINALPMFLELVMHDELYALSQKEVAEVDAYIRSKGYMDCKDDPAYWQKKVWNGDVCRVILISKGVGEKSGQFYRCEAFFKKGGDMPFEEKDAVYVQYLKDLII